MVCFDILFPLCGNRSEIKNSNSMEMNTSNRILKFLAIFLVSSIMQNGFCKEMCQQDDRNDVEKSWKLEANARIEQYRKENVRIVVKQNGRIATGASVKMEMLRNEFLFGCNIFRWGNGGEAYRQLFAGLFNFATLPFYWTGIEQSKDNFNFSGNEKIAAWCAENSIRTKGHPLFYNSNESAWMQSLSQKELLKEVTDYVSKCSGLFRGKIDTWDVINEFTGYREYFAESSPHLTGLIDRYGRSRLGKKLFAAARSANPDAMLIVNDNHPDSLYAAFLQQLTKKKLPVYDVTGIQSHMHNGSWDNEKLWNVCELLAESNKPIHFTELTILSTVRWNGEKDHTPADTAGEEKQKEEVERVYTMLFSHPAVEAITWWDFSDNGAWMNAPAGLIRNDMTPKPAYNILKKLIKEDWTTNETLTTGVTGEATGNAFRGEYRFTVTLADGTKRIFTDVISKKNTEIILNL
jgi:GH35 family endo-1,4-beta-xylanase